MVHRVPVESPSIRKLLVEQHPRGSDGPTEHLQLLETGKSWLFGRRLVVFAAATFAQHDKGLLRVQGDGQAPN